MLRFVAKRALSLVVVLFFLTVTVFVLGKVGNADPVRTYVGVNASPEAIARARAELGLDEPVPVQFWNFLTGLFQGDLGVSLGTKRPIVDDLAGRFPATLELALSAIVLAVLIGVVLSSLYTRPGRFGAAVRVLFFGIASAPSFLVATAGVLIFYKHLHWPPASRRGLRWPGYSPTGSPPRWLHRGRAPPDRWARANPPSCAGTRCAMPRPLRCRC